MEDKEMEIFKTVIIETKEDVNDSADDEIFSVPLKDEERALVIIY